MGLAALTLRIPLVLTEADSRLGLTNGLLAPFARRVCLAFPARGPRRRAATASPVGRFPRPARIARAARERLGIAPEETCVLVFGGSLGARSINLAALEAFAGAEFHVLHVSGRRDHSELADRELPAGYDLREYLDLAGFADALAAADLVLARAGGSVFEIAAHGLPAILVPYPHAAGDHQSANARWMTEAGAAITVPDGELTAARVSSETLALLADRPRLRAMASASRRLARPEAAAEVARELLGSGEADERTVERAPGSLRRRRRSRDERLCARRACPRGARSAARTAINSSYLERLAADGILQASVGHAAENVPAGEGVEVVYSSAVPAENVERAAARERGLPERPRSELLSELTALRRTIAVAGTHGKTTTASMLVHALRSAGLEPGWLVGGSVGEGLANAEWASGEWLVVEADESDRSMLSLNVEIAVLTNVELDHHATFRSLGELREAFRQFLAGAPQAVIWDRHELLELRTGPVDPYDAVEPTLTAGGSCFTWRDQEVCLAVPGLHNAVNAAGALEAARLAGADSARAIAGALRLPRRRTALSAARPRVPAARSSTTTTPTIRPRSPPPSRRRARSSTGGWWPSSSLISTRAPRCSRVSSAWPWRAPT